MKIIRPMAVTDAVLTSSNVVETAPSAWSGATTYPLGQTVSVATGTALDVYVSLQNTNLNHAPASSPTWWEYLSTTYANYSSGATYALDDRVIDASSGVHKVYQSAQAANIGHALTDIAWWLEVGATNRWAMFDGIVGRQTTNADLIDVVIATVGRVDSVALLNISAASARIIMTDVTAGTVYDTTFALVSNSGIIDWYAYFFEPIVRKTDLVAGDLPLYSGATIEVRLIDTGSMVECGECVLGLSRNLGLTQHGASVGITDYSVKSTDTFGNITVVERAFNKRGSFEVWVKNSTIDEVFNILATYRATPAVYVGSDSFTSMVIYGFFNSFSIAVPMPEDSILTVEIEGLT